MANYAVLVTFLLGIFLPSNLAFFCADSNKAEVQAQALEAKCAGYGGWCHYSRGCELGCHDQSSRALK